MVSHKCNECVYCTKRKFDLKRHMKNVHGVAKNTGVPIKSSDAIRQLGDGLPRRQPRADPEDGLYTKEEYEENMACLRARFPTMNFDTIDPRFMHPFTAIIAGPSQSGKSKFCMRLIRNARVCIAPPPRTYSVLLQRIPTFIRPISQRGVCRGTTGFEYV